MARREANERVDLWPRTFIFIDTYELREQAPLLLLLLAIVPDLQLSSSFAFDILCTW
jgi:hypothetical protein